MSFENFKDAFKRFYKKEENIYDFISDVESGKNPLEAVLVEDNDNIAHDSVGNEDSHLSRVFYFREFEIHVKFEGTRRSYEGEEWNTMKEVKPVIKKFKTYE